MLSLPVRVELQVGVHSGGPACSLTLPNIPFSLKPAVGDYVLLCEQTEQPFALCVKAVAHYTQPPSAIVLTRPIPCETYDDMLENLDWFKARYEVEDIQAEEAPEPYYVLYRTVVHLLEITDDVHIIRYDPDRVKVLAETCRTIWIANLLSCRENTNGRLPLRADVADLLQSTNNQIEAFHRLVFGYRQQHPKGPDLRRVIKEWDSVVNPDGELNWNVDDDLCRFIGGVIFDRLKCEKPEFLRAES